MTDQNQNSNPLLQRVRIPGEVHRLPSGGLMYSDGELSPDVTNGEIEIFPMNAYDEVTVRSPDLLFNGEAVKRVISHCVPQVLKPSRLFAKDVDFLMTVIRKVSYGETYEITYTHDCENAKEHSYPISLEKFITTAKAIDPTTVASKFVVALPNGQTVKLNPVRYETIVRLMQAMGTGDPNEKFKTIEQRHQAFLEIIRDTISGVDEVTDINQITEWLDAIPVAWAKQINTAAEASTDWGPEFTITIKCKDCGKEAVVTTSLNPLSFFIEL